MQCKQCNAILDPDAKFCADCGFPVMIVSNNEEEQEQTAQPEYEIRHAAPAGFRYKNIIVAAIAAVIIISAAVYFLSSAKYAYIESMPVAYGDVVSLSASVKYTFDDGIKLMQHSLDGTKAFVLTEADELYYTDGKAPVRIASDVYAFIVSDTGAAVAYYTDRERISGEYYATLRLYTLSGGKQDVIARDIPLAEISGYAGVILSPDGKTVCYIGELEADYREINIRSYIWQNGERESMPANVIPSAVSNNKKLIYYIRLDQDGNDASLNVAKADDVTRLIPSVSGISSIGDATVLTRDYTQVLFSYDGRTFISINGGERQRVAGAEMTGPMLPFGVQSGSYVIGVDSLADTYFYAKDGIYHIDGKYEGRRVISNYDSAVLADDGKTIFFTVNNRLYKINAADPDADRAELTDERVQGFAVTPGGKSVYYTNNRGELFYIKPNGDENTIRTDERITALAAAKDGDKLFFVDDGMLYVSEKGGARKRVSSPDADNISEFTALNDGSMLYRSGGDIYRSDGGEEFRLVVSIYPAERARLGNSNIQGDVFSAADVCKGNQRTLGSLQAMYYAENSDVTYYLDDLQKYIAGGVYCPSGGTYSIVGNDPYIWECSIPGHQR